jgi:serine/threonine-protein kinase HipA
MSDKRHERVAALSITLHGTQVGILVNYANSKNILVFSPEYQKLHPALKPTVSLAQIDAPQFLANPQMTSIRLPPVLSNLLPEGALRKWMAQGVKVSEENEFPLLAYVGDNLPGAIRAIPLAANEVPPWALINREQAEPILMDLGAKSRQFSLAGVQIKFSSAYKDGRYNIDSGIEGDNWIIKTPSTIHLYVPENEYTVMRLAESIGVDIPEIKLVELADLNGLPDIALPNESYAYAIKRFDRTEQGRVHTEDFAQIFNLYASDKYDKANYEMIGRTLFKYSSIRDVQQLAVRLLANILLGNGDAHTKNFSVIYPDHINPELSPAYDIVFTAAYIQGERKTGLNMAKEKDWYRLSLAHFEVWSNRVGVPWIAVRESLYHAIEKSKLWPELLTDLPMHEAHKQRLRAHWAKLQDDFKL